MCGITGYWGREAPSTNVLELMANRIASRGPDDSGLWIDMEQGLALAHRRLSILDLSPAGHQPMLSPCQRYVLVYNGEIYNHLDIRSELEAAGAAFNWRGHSDTETLLAAICYWGVSETLKRLNGMFAFALWDSFERAVYLARDRMGEKPLYYGISGSTFLFGSELKSLTTHPEWKGDVDRDALALYMRYKYVPSPKSIYVGIHKLPPATYLVVRDQGREVGSPVNYWPLNEIAEQGIISAKEFTGNVIDELEPLLSDSIQRRMVADVPLGVFLSGGYDSTIITALMQANSSEPVNTFSIGFEEASFNEAEDAKGIANYLGTQHTELYVTPQDALDVIPMLPDIYDEPFAGSSQIPTFLVSQMASQHVRVALSGDGGDELFGGYNRHVAGPGIWRRLNKVPLPLRRVIAGTLQGVSAGERVFGQYLPRRFRLPQLEVKLEKLSSAARMGSGVDFYKDLVSLWKDPAQVVLGANEPKTLLDLPQKWPETSNLRELMMFWDMGMYLPDEILTKVDRASMAVGLEARAPLLDHRLVEFAWRVPTEYKVRGGKGKWLLRELLYKHVPREMMERPKKGFAVPIGDWLRGPLREWAEELLNEKRMQDQGFFDTRLIRSAWQDHLDGKGGYQYQIWTVLMFQAWLESINGKTRGA